MFLPKSPNIFPNIWATFVIPNLLPKLSKIAQSGHADNFVTNFHLEEQTELYLDKSPYNKPFTIR